MPGPNPILFREMSIPFADSEAADAAFQAFFDEVGELRKKHKIPTIYLIGNGSYMADGAECEFLITGCYGNPLQGEAMTAYAFGTEQAKRQTMIESLLTPKKTRKKLVEK